MKKYNFSLFCKFLRILENGIGHWAIVKFDPKKFALYYYDSLSLQNNEVIKSIEALIKNNFIFYKIEFPEIFKKKTIEVPKQKNFKDCGVYLCKYAEEIINAKIENFKIM